MTEENKTPDFASEQAGEFWAEMKAEYGDDVNVDDIEGTGKDGAITKSDVQGYIDSLEFDDEADEIDIDDEADKDETEQEIEGKELHNLTDNKMDVEGVLIAPKGVVELTDALAKSKRVAHGVETGVFAIK